MLVVLLDPEKVSLSGIPQLLDSIEKNADLIFVGGSTVKEGDTQKLVAVLKKVTSIPIVLFPGDHTQIAKDADALLFLSLISGDNAEYLIGQQIKSVPALQKLNLEVIPTGYILIDGSAPTSVQKVSNTKPICRDDIQKATHTAVAAMYLGKKLIYLEAGSGAKKPVPLELIKEVSQHCPLPLIVGGGIRTAEQLSDAYQNGADIVVIGTAFENNDQFFDDF